MQTESKNSVVTLIKNVSEIHKDVQNKSISIAITKIEYQLLIKELWEMDVFLKEKYPDYQSVPQIYTLFGVKIEVAG